MIRSILVALDDTAGAQRARDLAIDLARRSGATLTAATVLDWPHVKDAHEAVPAGAAAFKERRDAARAKRAGGGGRGRLRRLRRRRRARPPSPACA